jgi:hypothetical protein
VGWNGELSNLCSSCIQGSDSPGSYSNYSRTSGGGGGAVVPATANITALVLSILPLLKSSLERVLYYVFRDQEMKHPRKESPMWT